MYYNECPICSHNEFYVKTHFTGNGNFYYSYDGSDVDNSELHDGINYHSGKYAYCGKCDKRLFKFGGNIDDKIT